jgi:hypothetical protein
MEAQNDANLGVEPWADSGEFDPPDSSALFKEARGDPLFMDFECWDSSFVPRIAGGNATALRTFYSIAIDQSPGRKF